MLGKPLLEGHGEPPDPVALNKPVLGPINREWLIYALGLAGTAVVWLLVQRYESVGWLLAAGSLVVLGYLGWFMVTKCTKIERERLMLALVLIAVSVVFWTLFEQAGSSMNQFAERNTAPAAERLLHHQRAPGAVVQLRLHPDLRPGVRGGLGVARQARQGPRPGVQVRHGPVAGGPRLRRAGVGREVRGRRLPRAL